MKSKFLSSLFIVASLAALTGCGVSDPTELAPKATLVGRYALNAGAGVSEIVAYHAESRSVFITVDTSTAPSSFQRISLKNLTSTVLANPITASNLEAGGVISVAQHVNGSGFTAGGVQTLAINGNLMAIAVQATPKTDLGVVAFYRLDAQGNATYLKKVTVGSLPDGMAFSPDGSKLVIANEGELSVNFATDGIDPVGSISIITIANGIPADSATTLDFSAFNAGANRANELPADVRIGRPGATVAQDMEPEFVTISADNSQAFVTLQENNAVAVVNLTSNRIDRIIPMGYKNHGLAANAIAASDKVSATSPFVLKPYANLFGIYMPDGIASFSVNGTNYFITANEGDDRDDFLPTGQKETVRVGSSSMVLSSSSFPTATDLKKDAELGRLTVFSTMGRNSNGQFDKLYTLGGRSFSIYNASTGAQVFDSGSDLETLAYSTMASSLLSKDQVLGRLDNKGPEPESVVVGQVNQKTYAFVALERSSAILMYDLTNPAAPKFVQWLQNTTDLTNGDISPEGLTFVPASQSPTGQALLVAGHEVSGTVSVWEIK
jgi:DNA-binding beta-propeller fold protein YncE